MSQVLGAGGAIDMGMAIMSFKIFLSYRPLAAPSPFRMGQDGSSNVEQLR